MASTVMMPEVEYGLAEKAILSERLLSASTLPDVLARPDVLTPAGEPDLAKRFRVALPERGGDILIGIRDSGDFPRNLLDSIKSIVALLNLPPGWNSYSAKPIAHENAIRAIRLLCDLMRLGIAAPIVVPRVRGGIQLEWHTEVGDIEIYIDSPGQISFFAEDAKSGESTEAPLAGHEEVLRAWVQRISGK